MNTKHTPEPWVYRPYPNPKIMSCEISSSGSVIAAVCSLPLGIGENNAARIVACVNACAGMEDPAKEIATLRARIAELEQPATETEPTTVLGWLQKLPDGYRERAIEQYDPEFVEKEIDTWGQPKEMQGAIRVFALWEKTIERGDFWYGVYNHYDQGTPLPPLPI